MNCLKSITVLLCLLLGISAFSQPAKRILEAKKITGTVKIDGILDDVAWKDAPVADKFVSLKPVPFLTENTDNASQVYMLYNNYGIYVGGYFHEKNRDSIATELSGRDGFGNNDFAGVVFDTYDDKLNGFEYFVTPLGEQWDAKVSSAGNEDFGWNAVWRSAAKLQPDGWSFEMFLPYSCIRFGKKKVQDWGFNIVRKRQKSGQQLFWQSIDPNVNGFLTQEGLYKGLEDIKPPLRLQFSPYYSSYINHDGLASGLTSKNTTTVSGGADVKYGINQAFTLDMTLIPDFGQVQSDNIVLNLSPFEQKFSDNRPFFTEGTELFNKGGLFYSRRIGISPIYKKPINYDPAVDNLVKYPEQAKIINATKISGRTQKGLGIGILNAITQTQFATLQNKSNGSIHQEENMPLTNYNVFVLDQTFKHNSSISLINTNVWRSGSAYDANVTSGLFDLNDKTNTWNLGGNISVSHSIYNSPAPVTGYAHSFYFGKTSGRLVFIVSQDLYNDKYNKSDLGYFTNNNSMDNYGWVAYKWTKPKHWYNQVQLNFNIWYSRLVSPIDILKRKELMYQNFGGNINGNAQTKKLWWIGFNMSANAPYNDFYEPRVEGRFFRNKGNFGINVWWNSNDTKKLSWGGSYFIGEGGVFHRTGYEVSLFGKIRFNKKFSIDGSLDIQQLKNQPGWAFIDTVAGNPIVFSRRSLNTAYNILNIKYNFTNRMGLTARVTHSWTKVIPQQFYSLNMGGKLDPYTSAYNANQNYNYFTVDMVYSWQFAQGSFINIVWKDIAENFNDHFEKNYFSNLGKTISERGYNNQTQYNSFSLKVIYFIDYLTVKRRLKKHE